MRTLLVLASLLLLALPTAAAVDPLPEVRCDIDDDLYQHCNVGDVHFVYGYGPCVGANVKGEPAQCRTLVDPNGIIYLP